MPVPWSLASTRPAMVIDLVDEHVLRPERRAVRVAERRARRVDDDRLLRQPVGRAVDVVDRSHAAVEELVVPERDEVHARSACPDRGDVGLGSRPRWSIQFRGAWTPPTRESRRCLARQSLDRRVRPRPGRQARRAGATSANRRGSSRKSSPRTSSYEHDHDRSSCAGRDRPALLEPQSGSRPNAFETASAVKERVERDGADDGRRDERPRRRSRAETAGAPPNAHATSAIRNSGSR